jgi:hypothetical protein
MHAEGSTDEGDVPHLRPDPKSAKSSFVSGWQHLRKVGTEFIVGGLVVAAVSLAVLVYDESANRGTDVVVATCVLFLWIGGIAICGGLVLRAVVRAKTTRPQRSPFSPGWTPPPVIRARSRR